MNVKLLFACMLSFVLPISLSSGQDGNVTYRVFGQIEPRFDNFDWLELGGARPVELEFSILEDAQDTNPNSNSSRFPIEEFRMTISGSDELDCIIYEKCLDASATVTFNAGNSFLNDRMGISVDSIKRIGQEECEFFGDTSVLLQFEEEAFNLNSNGNGIGPVVAIPNGLNALPFSDFFLDMSTYVISHPGGPGAYQTSTTNLGPEVVRERVVIMKGTQPKLELKIFTDNNGENPRPVLWNSDYAAMFGIQGTLPPYSDNDVFFEQIACSVNELFEIYGMDTGAKVWDGSTLEPEQDRSENPTRQQLVEFLDGAEPIRVFVTEQAPIELRGIINGRPDRFNEFFRDEQLAVIFKSDIMDDYTAQEMAYAAAHEIAQLLGCSHHRGTTLKDSPVESFIMGSTKDIDPDVLDQTSEKTFFSDTVRPTIEREGVKPRLHNPVFHMREYGNFPNEEYGLIFPGDYDLEDGAALEICVQGIYDCILNEVPTAFATAFVETEQVDEYVTSFTAASALLEAGTIDGEICFRAYVGDTISLFAITPFSNFAGNIFVEDLAGDDLVRLDSFDSIDVVIKQFDPTTNMESVIGQSQIEVTPVNGVLLGDVNQDGNIDLLDVAPFVALLTNGDTQFEADINQDGVVDLLDVAPFVDLLTGS